MNEARFFPSKLLLIGEYTLLLGAPGLAVPYAAYGGAWQFLGEGKVPHLSQLQGFAAHLRQLGGFDAARLEADLDAHWGFGTNIPVGYGLGSSGALCAAVYAQYALDPLPPDPAHAAALRELFAQMEHFFHGNSSGVDPLVSYLQKPLLLRSRTEAIAVGDFRVPEAWRLFLLDTGTPRQTGPLVAHFVQRCEDESYKAACLNSLTPANADAVAALLAGDTEALWTAWQAISRFQWGYFSQMIPDALLPLWEAGLDSGTFALKLCGAGGGGFLLGMARQPLEEIRVLQAHVGGLRVLKT